MINLIKKIKTFVFAKWVLIIFSILVILQTAYTDFSIVHIVFELFNSFIVLYAAFTITNCKHSEKSNIYDYIGFSFGFMGIFNLLHIFTYGSAEILKSGSLNISMQYCLCSDFIGVGAFVAIYNLINNYSKLSSVLSFVYYSTIFAAFLTISVFKIFPLCYIRESYFTIFTKGVLGFLIFILVVILFMFIKAKEKIDKDIYIYLICGVIFLAIYLFLTLFNEKNGITLMMISHIAKAIVFYSSYKIIMVINLDRSYKVFITK